MTDKNQEQKKEGGCCGGNSKAMTSSSSCSTEKAEASKTDSKGKSGGCGCN